MNEPKRCRVNAVAQSAAILGAVRENVTQMAVAVGGAHLGAALPGVRTFMHVGGIKGLGEAGPAAAGVELVGRREQRFTGHDIDVDARFLVVQILPGTREFSRSLLRDAILLPWKGRNGFGVFPVRGHFLLLAKAADDASAVRQPPHESPSYAAP